MRRHQVVDELLACHDGSSFLTRNIRQSYHLELNISQSSDRFNGYQTFFFKGYVEAPISGSARLCHRVDLKSIREAASGRRAAGNGRVGRRHRRRRRHLRGGRVPARSVRVAVSCRVPCCWLTRSVCASWLFLLGDRGRQGAGLDAWLDECREALGLTVWLRLRLGARAVVQEMQVWVDGMRRSCSRRLTEAVGKGRERHERAGCLRAARCALQVDRRVDGPGERPGRGAGVPRPGSLRSRLLVHQHHHVGDLPGLGPYGSRRCGSADGTSLLTAVCAVADPGDPVHLDE